MDANDEGRRYTGYETTMTAASRRMRARDVMSYREGLAAPPLPSEPPSYHKAVSDWLNAYPECRDKDGTPWPPAPSYPREQEEADRLQREADPQRHPPPTYTQAIAQIARVFERRVDRYVRNMRIGLEKEFSLPFPSEADISVAGGAYTGRGRWMKLLRTTRFARQAELLQLHQRELTRLPELIERLRECGADPGVTDRLQSAYALAIDTYRSFESRYSSLALSGEDSSKMDPLPDGDIPFHRWGENQAEHFLLEAIALYGGMRAELQHEFAVPLPRVRGLRARILLPRARRNELRYERSRRLEQRGELLAHYFSRLRELGERRARGEKSLRAGAWLLGEIDETLDEMAQFLMSARIEHQHQLSRSP
jgi:signal transduction histidine kinase